MKQLKTLEIAMAKSKAEAKEKIEDLALTCAMHIAYITFFDDAKLQKKWRNEISGYMYRVWGWSLVRTKKCIQTLSASDVEDYLYETLWMGDKVDRLEHFYLHAVDHNKKLKPSVKLKNLSQAEKEKIAVRIHKLYVDLISDMLSKTYVRSSSERLIQQYMDSSR